MGGQTRHLLSSQGAEGGVICQQEAQPELCPGGPSSMCNRCKVSITASKWVCCSLVDFKNFIHLKGHKLINRPR